MENKKTKQEIKNKKRIAKAKSLVIGGATLKEASRQTGVSENILRKHSAKEKWMKQQESFLQDMTTELISKYGEQHIKGRIEAIENLNYIKNLVMEELENIETDIEAVMEKMKIYKMAVSIIEKSIMGQSYIMGIPNVSDILTQKIIKEQGKEETDPEDRVIIINTIPREPIHE